MILDGVRGVEEEGSKEEEEEEEEAEDELASDSMIFGFVDPEMFIRLALIME